MEMCKGNGNGKELLADKQFSFYVKMLSILQRNYSSVKPALIVQGIMAVLGILLSLLLVVFLAMSPFQAFDFMRIVVLLVGAAVSVYQFIVLYSLYSILKREYETVAYDRALGKI